MNMLQVFHPILVEYEDVIQIICENMQDIIHHPHESCWGIFQTKGNDQPFEKTLFGPEGNFPYIGLLYWDMVVARLQIHITQVFGPLSWSKSS